MKLTLEKVAGMLNEDLVSLQSQISNIASEIRSVKQAQEEIMMRLGRYAYRIDVEQMVRKKAQNRY